MLSLDHHLHDLHHQVSTREFHQCWVRRGEWSWSQSPPGTCQQRDSNQRDHLSSRTIWQPWPPGLHCSDSWGCWGERYCGVFGLLNSSPSSWYSVTLRNQTVSSTKYLGAIEGSTNKLYLTIERYYCDECAFTVKTLM